MAEKYITVLPGEGVGLEVVPATVRVLEAVAKLYGHRFVFNEQPIGKTSYSKGLGYFPEQTREACDTAQRENGAILFGSVTKEPLLDLRKGYNLFANLRPVKVLDELVEASSLKPEIVNGLDILFVRELVGDIYFGKMDRDETHAYQVMDYTPQQVEQIARVAFELAMQRKKHVTMVHKDNAIPLVFGLWHDVVNAVRQEYNDVSYDSMYVDNNAMQLVINPQQFDVILASNLFGDIVSDIGGALTGSLGMLPSASLNENKFGLYESVGGTAPLLAGKNIANPCATILSAAMMLEYSLGLEIEARAIEQAVQEVLKTHRTQDIMHAGRTLLDTQEMADLIARQILKTN